MWILSLNKYKFNSTLYMHGIFSEKFSFCANTKKFVIRLESVFQPKKKNNCTIHDFAMHIHATPYPISNRYRNVLLHKYLNFANVNQRNA